MPQPFHTGVANQAWSQAPGEQVWTLRIKRGENRDNIGAGEGLLSAICSLFLPFARVCTFQRGFWQKRKLSPQSQRVPSGWNGGRGIWGRAGTGEDKSRGLFHQLGLRVWDK